MRCNEFLCNFFWEFQISESEFQFLDFFNNGIQKKIRPESLESKAESEFRFQWGSQKLEPKIGIPNQAPKSLCRYSLWVRCRHPALGLCTQPLVPLFGINFEATSKNREIGRALALGGRRSINIFNNQMEVGVQGWGIY